MSSNRVHAEVRHTRQQAWREVNEAIAAAADALSDRFSDADESWMFMCECGLPGCAEMIGATLGSYRRARLDGAFFVLPGHQDADDDVLDRSLQTDARQGRAS